MISGLLTDIIRYFDHLIQEGYYVSFHNLSIPMQNYMDILTPYNINSNPFCLLVKTSHEAWDHCIERQGRVACACEKGPIFGMCYAGASEYCFPIQDREGAVLAFISVSGYRGCREDAIQRMSAISQKYNLPADKLMDTYQNNLKDPLANPDALAAKIQPLCRMFELLNMLLSDLNIDSGDGSRSQVLSLAVVYLRRNYARNITVEDVAKVCHCSGSTLSHMFKKELGLGIRDYIKNLRIADAVQMLRNTDLSIAAISDMLGYSNPSYFCRVFIQEKGVSPSKFRTNGKK